MKTIAVKRAGVGSLLNLISTGASQQVMLEARVVNMNYGQGALPTNSFFDQLTLELAIWPKS